EGWGPLSPSRPVDFTMCFEHGVLVTGANALFLVAAIVRLRTLRSAPLLPRALVVGSLFWVKLSLAVATLAASVAELAFATFAYSSVCAFTVSMGLQTAAAVAAVRLHYREQLRNRVASTPLLLFWLATVLLALIRLRTAVSMDLVETQPAAVVANTLFMLAALATMALECQSKPHGLYQLPDDDKDDVELKSPEDRANLFSRLTFSWLTPLLEQGFRKPLQMEDMLELSKRYQPDVATTEFQRNWQAEQQRRNPSLFRATIRTYGAVWALGGFYKLVSDLVSFVNPILLSKLIGFVSTYHTPAAEPIQNGYFYALSMFVVASVQTLVFQQHWVQNQHVNCLIKISYTTAIYRKTMALSNDARQKYSVGSIVTHMSVDSQRVANFTADSSHQLWSLPLQIVLALFLLYRTLGWTVYAGVLAMLISIPISAQLSRSMRALNKLLMGYRDQRMKIMDEVLSGIKIIKLYAWESSFIRRINEVRVKLELETIRHYGLIQAVFTFVTTVVPFAISFSTFGLYSLADNVSHGPLTPQLVFVSLTLFNMLRFPLSFGPTVIPALLEAMV
ncbi:hypothetical protein GGH20_001951, partial [Coemansia sp. RSA 1937]